MVTPASFEPTIDYVVTKVPRFTFEKFPKADSRLTTQMKSVGEVMSIGRTFKQALGKGPGWRRHVPPAVLLTALIVLLPLRVAERSPSYGDGSADGAGTDRSPFPVPRSLFPVPVGDQFT